MSPDLNQSFGSEKILQCDLVDKNKHSDVYWDKDDIFSTNDEPFTIPQLDGMDSPLSGLESPVSRVTPFTPPIVSNPGGSNHPPLTRSHT